MTGCECIYHRYHVVHTVSGSDRVYDHSQGTWDDHLRMRDDVETYPSSLYRHGMIRADLIGRKSEEVKK